MSKAMTAAEFLVQLKKWNVKFHEVDGWRTHNRNSKGPWGPLNGLIWHHTGADVSNGASYAAGTLYKGRSDLPGPLCHAGLAPDGTLYLVGWGRANHAGGGDPVTLGHVIAEDYTGILHPKKGNLNGIDGNSRFYGIEIMYSGSHGMSAAQYQAGLKISAAILDFHKWSSKSVIGHGEWSNDKWDPGYAPSKMMDMNAVRNDVHDTLTGVQPIPVDPNRKLEWLPVKGYMPELHYGDKNWYVDYLQRNLNRFLTPNVKVDGHYGPETAEAVDKFYKTCLSFQTTTHGHIFGADGWRRVLSIADKEG